jgi:hypothetical protein
MTSRQRALHTIFSALGFFPPEFRDRAYRWGAGLSLLFGKNQKDDPDANAALAQLEGGILDLVLSASTSAFSESAREKWFAGVVADSEAIDPAACAAIRKYARA